MANTTTPSLRPAAMPVKPSSQTALNPNAAVLICAGRRADVSMGSNHPEVTARLSAAQLYLMFADCDQHRNSLLRFLHKGHADSGESSKKIRCHEHFVLFFHCALLLLELRIPFKCLLLCCSATVAVRITSAGAMVLVLPHC